MARVEMASMQGGPLKVSQVRRLGLTRGAWSWYCSKLPHPWLISGDAIVAGLQSGGRRTDGGGRYALCKRGVYYRDAVEQDGDAGRLPSGKLPVAPAPSFGACPPGRHPLPHAAGRLISGMAGVARCSCGSTTMRGRAAPARQALSSHRCSRHATRFVSSSRAGDTCGRRRSAAHATVR